MTNEYETIEEDISWQPGPAIKIDWWGGNFDEDIESDIKYNSNELELE